MQSCAIVYPAGHARAGLWLVFYEHDPSPALFVMARVSGTQQQENQSDQTIRLASANEKNESVREGSIPTYLLEPRLLLVQLETCRCVTDFDALSAEWCSAPIRLVRGDLGFDRNVAHALASLLLTQPTPSVDIAATCRSAWQIHDTKEAEEKRFWESIPVLNDEQYAALVDEEEDAPTERDHQEQEPVSLRGEYMMPNFYKAPAWEVALISSESATQQDLKMALGEK
jgi:hypothetical protein